MIDWFNLVANSLWILGCAMALAIFSYASWKASLANEKLRVHLSSPGALKSWYVAGIFFCAGLSGASDSTLQAVFWAVLGSLFLIQLIFMIYGKEGEKTGQDL